MDRSLLDEGFATSSVLELDLMLLPPDRDDDEPAPAWLADPAFAFDAFLDGLAEVGRGTSTTA